LILRLILFWPDAAPLKATPDSTHMQSGRRPTSTQVRSRVEPLRRWRWRIPYVPSTICVMSHSREACTTPPPHSVRGPSGHSAPGRQRVTPSLRSHTYIVQEPHFLLTMMGSGPCVRGHWGHAVFSSVRSLASSLGINGGWVAATDLLFPLSPARQLPSGRPRLSCPALTTTPAVIALLMDNRDERWSTLAAEYKNVS
jgi:hypothetical protein